MRRLGNSCFAKTVLLLCVLMQAVALIPHHHHATATAVCLNYAHLYKANPCGSICTGSNAHHTQPYASCLSHGITVAQPQQEEDGIEEPAADHAPDCGCAACTADFETFVTHNRTETAFHGYGRHSDPEPYIRIYLTDALPCRAPDFMC